MKKLSKVMRLAWEIHRKRPADCHIWIPDDDCGPVHQDIAEARRRIRARRKK